MYRIVAVLLFFIPSCDSVDEKISANISKLQNLKVYELPKQPDTIGWEYERSLNLNNAKKDYLIGQIGSINFYKQNYIFISDPIKNCIHVFDWKGNYLKNIGREGRGPGEFMQISSVKIVGDKLYVLDIVMSQLHIFSVEDLAFLKTTNISPKRISKNEKLDGYLPRRFIIKSDGNLLIGFGKTINVNEAEKQRKLLYYEINQQGEIISDLIIQIQDRVFLSTSSNADGNPRIASFPFSPFSQIMTFSDGEIIFYESSDFLIKKYNSKGKYQSSFYYKYPKQSLKRDIVYKEYPSNYHKKIIDDNKLPDFWPVISNIYIDEANQLWIQLHSKPNENKSLYWILDDDGEFIAQFELPNKYIFKTVSNDHLYVIEEGSPFVLKEYKINFSSYNK